MLSFFVKMFIQFSIDKTINFPFSLEWLASFKFFFPIDPIDCREGSIKLMNLANLCWKIFYPSFFALCILKLLLIKN